MRKWTEKEIELLKTEYPMQGAKRLCEIFDRSQGSITGKARNLGLSCEVCVTPIRNMKGKKNPNWKDGASIKIQNIGSKEYSAAYFYSIKRLYGLSKKEYLNLLKDQLGCCAICGRSQEELSGKLCVDHNHETQRVRGLLCKKCNVAVGWLELHEKNMVDYLY